MSILKSTLASNQLSLESWPIERLSHSADLLDRWIGVVDAGAVDS
jgi:hypothetical protein